jgi:hypothetical protein
MSRRPDRPSDDPAPVFTDSPPWPFCTLEEWEEHRAGLEELEQKGVSHLGWHRREAEAEIARIRKVAQS